MNVAPRVLANEESVAVLQGELGQSKLLQVTHGHVQGQGRAGLHLHLDAPLARAGVLQVLAGQGAGPAYCAWAWACA